MAAATHPPPPTVDLLLNLIDTRPQSILTSLERHPQLASAADAHGYSLVHAAASYNQLPVLRDLVHKYKVNVDQLDEDGESPLFAAESVQVARCLVEELGADWRIRNAEGKTAEEKLGEEEGEVNDVYRYLKSLRGQGSESSSDQIPTPSDAVHPPPPLPDGIKINMGTMEEDAVGGDPDPELRRRIEELASRDDFQSEEGQSQLRELIAEVVTGIGTEESGRNAKRRA